MTVGPYYLNAETQASLMAESQRRRAALALRREANGFDSAPMDIAFLSHEITPLDRRVADRRSSDRRTSTDRRASSRS